jgi:hypothetical protein
MDLDPTDLTRGVNAVWDSENIAIVVLFLVAIGEGALVFFLLRGLLSMKDVLSELKNSITVLNERIGHADKND